MIDKAKEFLYQVYVISNGCRTKEVDIKTINDKAGFQEHESGKLHKLLVDDGYLEKVSAPLLTHKGIKYIEREYSEDPKIATRKTERKQTHEAVKDELVKGPIRLKNGNVRYAFASELAKKLNKSIEFIEADLQYWEDEGMIPN